MKPLHEPDDEPLSGVSEVEDDGMTTNSRRCRAHAGNLQKRAPNCITFCAAYGVAQKIASMQRGPCYTPPVPPFEPRSRSKRTRFLASIRISDEEKKIVDWLTEHLSEKEGEAYTSADVVRVALARLYEAEKGQERSHNASTQRREH
jgi:hypothetical protein